MSELCKKTANAIAKYARSCIAIGVSGGRDSMCLLHAVINCGAVDKSTVIAVHVNHNLRETAARDEKLVRDFCAKNGVAFRAYSIDVKKESASKRLTIEQAARELRYGIFNDIITGGDADVVFTAHHALDNAESVLMHMFRGAGLDGMCAMDERNAARPFIDVYPDELELYARENNIEYVTDETNLDDSADRNFIRLNVLPLIESRYAGAVRAINGLSHECADIREVVDSLIDESLIRADGRAVVIDERALALPLADRYVRRAISAFSLVDITRADIAAVIALSAKRSGARAELKHGIVAQREDGGVAIFVDGVIAPCETEELLRLGANHIDGLTVDIVLSDDSPKSVKGGAVDLDKLDGAVIRFRRDGDVFQPFGGGTKKLKQYFIDKKVPKRLRDRVPLICRGSEALVVVGYEISEKVKQTPATAKKAVVKLR